MFNVDQWNMLTVLNPQKNDRKKICVNSMPYFSL